MSPLASGTALWIPDGDEPQVTAALYFDINVRDSKSAW